MSRLSVTPLLWVALIAAALLGPALFWQSGTMDREATAFIRQYLADRPVIAKVFDPHANDIGTYQARELSYVIDFLDARFYKFLAERTGRPFFVPLSALVASALLAAIFLAGARRTTAHVDALTGALLLACFLTSFAFISTMGVFYRSGKPVLSAVLLAWMFQVRSVHQRRAHTEGAARRSDASLTFALAVLLGLLDRQGFFYVLAAGVMLFVHSRLTSGELRDLLKATVAAAVVLILYNVLVAPLLIQAVNGYWPDFSYQQLPASTLQRVQIHLSRAMRLLLMNAAMLAGGFTIVAFGGVLLASLLAWRRFGLPTRIRDRRGATRYLLHDRQGRVVLYGLLAFALQLLMFALMIARHVYIFVYADHRYWYYPLPFLVTVLFGLLIISEAALARLSAHERRVVPALLAAVAVSNMLSLGPYRDAMITGPYFTQVFRQSEILKTSITRGVADSRLEDAYRVFFDFDRRLRPAGPP